MMKKNTSKFETNLRDLLIKKATVVGVVVVEISKETQHGKITVKCLQCQKILGPFRNDSFLNRTTRPCICSQPVLFKNQTEKDKVKALHQKAGEIGVKIFNISGVKMDSRIEYQCLNHPDKKLETRVRNFLVLKNPHCCYSEKLHLKPGQALFDLLEKKKCTLIGPEPTSSKERFTFQCQRCIKKHVSYFAEFKRSSLKGAPCCSLKKDPDNPTQSKRRRSNRDPLTPLLLRWRRQVIRVKGKACEVTGVTGKGKVEIHHVYSSAHFPEYRLLVENSMILKTEIHKGYHSLNTFQKAATPESLIVYFQNLIENKPEMLRLGVTEDQLKKAIEVVHLIDQSIPKV